MNNSSYLYPYGDESFTKILLLSGSRIVFCIFAMAGNGFILYVIGRNPSIRRNLCNLLIGVLAFADLWTGIGLFFASCITLGFQLFEWHNYTIGQCLIIEYIGISGIQMSQIATVFIAVDRLKAVQNPLLYLDQDRIKRFSVALSVTIIYPLVATAFAFVGINFNEYPKSCEGGSIFNHKYLLFFELFAIVVAIIVIVCYVRTSRTMTKALKNAHSERFEKDLANQKAVLKTVRIVLIVYGLCWCLPNFITVVATVLGADPILLGKLSPIVAAGTDIYSCANVVIYAWKHKEFGAAMRKALSGETTTTTTTATVQWIELSKRKPAVSGHS